MTAILILVLVIVGIAVALGWLLFSRQRSSAAEAKVMKDYFLKGLAGMLAKLALADGQVTEDETQLALDCFLRMQITEDERRLCIDSFLLARRDGLSARDHAQRFMAYANPVACEFLYGLLWKMSAADGRLDAGEDALLKNLAQYLGLDQSVYTRFQQGNPPRFDRDTLKSCAVPESLLALA